MQNADTGVRAVDSIQHASVRELGATKEGSEVHSFFESVLIHVQHICKYERGEVGGTHKYKKEHRVFSKKNRSRATVFWEDLGSDTHSSKWVLSRDTAYIQ